MWIAFALLVVAVLLAIVLVVMLGRRASTQALAVRESDGRDHAEEERAKLLPTLVRELRPSFNESIARLRKAVRGIDFRYGVPWYLLIGPAEAGKTTLVVHAPKAPLAPQVASEDHTPSGIGWHYFDGGVIIDVSASLAMPGTRGDLTGWRALLHLLKSYRPRRPVEGIVVAVPASVLLDVSWKARTRDLGAAIRERLVLAQSELGFALPVYVVVTQADHLAGFSAFTEALPDNLQQDMFGWSNPHAPDVMFQGEWIDEAFDDLHRGIVHVQVELFAVSEHLEHASDLFLFSGELQRIAPALRDMLEEIFRPSVYRSASMFRGFYLSGHGPDRETAAVAPEAGAIAPSPISFVGDLLDRKVFSERGLAAPLPGASVARNRMSRVAQVTAALLAIILAAGTAWSSARLQRVRNAHELFLHDVGNAFDLRLKAKRQERAATDEERIDQGYHLVQGISRLSAEDFHSIFLPSSLVRPIEPNVGEILKATFQELILPDFRTGLEQKGRAVFAWSGNTASDDEDESARTKPTLNDSPGYRSLEQFAHEYRMFVDNYFRYIALSTEASGDLNELGDLGTYVTGHSSMARVDVPEEPYGRALREATARPVDCAPFTGLVERRGRDSLSRFGLAWFGEDNPVRASEDRFVEQWKSLIETGDAELHDVAGEMDTLTQAVSTWASIGARSGELRLPVLEQPPFKMLVSANLCDALKPDLSDAIRHVAAMRDGLSGSLLTVGTEPFGPLLVRGEKGLQLSDDMQEMKAAFDDLAKHDFRASLPAISDDVTLPVRATWRPEAIDHGVALFESFDRYRSAAFAHLAPAFRRPLLVALDADVAASMATRIAFDATEGEPLPSEPAALAAEIGRLGVRLTKIGRLIPFLENGDEPFARQLERALDEQATEALQQLEKDATIHHPFVFARQTESALTAFGEAQSGAATPADGLKRWGGYLDEQRESIRRYILQAEPLVRFLTTTHAASLATRRWTGLLDDVTMYDQKQAGNGLASLDAFLRDGLPTIVPERDCGAGSGLVPLRAGGSYLIGVRNDLLDEAMKHCRELARTGVQSRYATIAQSFNTLLAGRFPFTQAIDGTRDAAPADLVEFLRVYDRQDGRSLATQLQTRSCTDEPTRFLRRVDALIPLLAPARELQTLALDVVPEFRVNREREIGGDQIAQWTMTIGRQTFVDTDAVKPARWISGEPVQVTMRFAKDSPERPLNQPTAWRRAQDRTLRLSFQGAWALLGFLRAGHATAADLAASSDAAPNTLRFDIPVERDPDQRVVTTAAQTNALFRVFIRVRVFQPGKQDPITVDEFPAQAPPTVSCPGT